jgi:hypothetical protein
LLDLQIEFERGVPARGKVEAKPAFYRIYRFEQAADVARSIRGRYICQPCEGATAFGKQSPGRFKCLVIQFNRKLIMCAL